jgi:hypothetical protein
MSFRPSLIGAAVLALSLGLARQSAAQVGGVAQGTVDAVTKPVDPQVRIQISPRCAQPGGVLHVTLEPGSPERIGSFFDIFTERSFRPSFFDVFTEFGLRFRPAFFDVFLEMDARPDDPSSKPETVPLSLVCGFLTPGSIELLMQCPASLGGAGGGGGAGGVISVRCADGTCATAPVLTESPKSPIQHSLGSGQGICSFFDVFTELAFDGSGANTAKYRRVLLQQGRLILQTAGDAELDALALLFAGDSRLILSRHGHQILMDDLDRQLVMASKLGK